jgi:hypothetical protein
MWRRLVCDSRVGGWVVEIEGDDLSRIYGGKLPVWPQEPEAVETAATIY